MAFWVDDFEGNKLSSKWVATRISGGGQNDGSWYRDIKNSKLYGIGVNGGTEAAYWGEKFTLPVNIPLSGDFTIEVEMRQRINAAVVATRMGVCINDPVGGQGLRGVELFGGGLSNGWCARNFGSAPMPFPGRPAQTQIGSPNADDILKARMVRTNGYLKYFADNLYMGFENYPNALTAIYLYFSWWALASSNVDKWIHHVRVWPASVVL